MRSHFPKFCVCLSGIFLTLPLGAQTLRVTAVAGASGRDGSLTLAIASPPGKGPAGLQWDFLVPEALLMDAASASAGKAAQSAHKSIQCRIQVAAQGPVQGNAGSEKKTSFRCILIGGVDRISDGPVASLKYSARPETKPGKYAIEVVRGFAVSKDAKKAPLPDVSADIEILK